MPAEPDARNEAAAEDSTQARADARTDARAAAFSFAQDQRRARAELLERLGSGELSLRQAFALAATDEMIAKVKLLPTVEALPQMGKVTSRRLLASLQMEERARLGELAGSTQLDELIRLTDEAGQDSGTRTSTGTDESSQ